MATMNHPLGGARRGIPLPAPRINGWILASVLVLGLGAALPVLQNSVATSRGFDSQLLDAQQARLRGDIRLLESQVAQMIALERIEERATALGLVPAEDPLFVAVNQPGPAPASIPAEHLPGVVPHTDEPAPWWRSLVSWLPLPR
jgi:hypothetical protein